MEFKGIHEPIISKELFQRVQEVIRIRDYAGERKRKHPHYLRGTVFCGTCGSRMSSAWVKGKYLYFYCLGQKRANNCKEPYILAEHLESEIEDLYKSIELPLEVVEKLTLELEKEIAERESNNFKEKELLVKKLDNLNKQRFKLIEAYYEELVLKEVLKREQERILTEIALCENRLKVLGAKIDQAEKSLSKLSKWLSAAMKLT